MTLKRWEQLIKAAKTDMQANGKAFFYISIYRNEN